MAAVGLALSACSVAPLPLPTPTAECDVTSRPCEETRPAADERSPVPTVTFAPPPTATSPPPTATVVPSPTSPPPSPTVGALTEAGGGVLLFEYPFDSAGIWGVDETDAFKIEAAGGKMHISLKQADRWALTFAGRSAVDFYAELTTTDAGCSQDDSYGLLYRFVDANNFYYFGLGCGARYRVRHYQDAEWKELIDWTPAEAVLTEAEAENRLAVRAVGDRFYFFVNDAYLGEASDNSIAEGQFGLFAQSSVSAGLAVQFDNLQVREAAP